MTDRLWAGYTGKYTAEHITEHLPTDLKWAIAGRSREKLQKLADELKLLNPDRRQPGEWFPASMDTLHTLASPGYHLYPIANLDCRN